MQASDVIRLSGVAAALGGALRVAAAFIPPVQDVLELELLYFIIDVSLLFGLFGIYAAECERLGWLGLVGFVVAATGVASIVGPDNVVFGITIYNVAVSVIGIGLAILSVAMLWSGLPRLIPALWLGSFLTGLAAANLQDAQQAVFLVAGILFALGFLAAGVVLFATPRD